MLSGQVRLQQCSFWARGHQPSKMQKSASHLERLPGRWLSLRMNNVSTAREHGNTMRQSGVEFGAGYIILQKIKTSPD
jgi:hypothetical protein